MNGRSVVIGMAVTFAAYTLLFTGYVWIRGYDVSFLELVNPLNYYSGTWPPTKAAPTSIFPAGAKGSASATAPRKA